MSGAKFCSECGTPLLTDYASSWLARATCVRCRPRFGLARLLLIASFALCLALGYAIGRNATPRQPFPLLGTQLDPQASASAADAARPVEANKPMADSAPQTVSASSTTATICGATTKSGRPCQRKVAGGGYCWQHRDKYGAKQKAPDGK